MFKRPCCLGELGAGGAAFAAKGIGSTASQIIHAKSPHSFPERAYKFSREPSNGFLGKEAQRVHVGKWDILGP